MKSSSVPFFARPRRIFFQAALGSMAVKVNFANDERQPLLLIAQKGWEEVADYAVRWLEGAA